MSRFQPRWRQALLRAKSSRTGAMNAGRMQLRATGAMVGATPLWRRVSSTRNSCRRWHVPHARSPICLWAIEKRLRRASQLRLPSSLRRL
jgi:hypothetical protein